jgi:hypothetical protein
VFRFRGREWPVDDAARPTVLAPAPLPLLDELIWEAVRMVGGFEGAQPVVLWAPNRDIVKFVAASKDAGCGPLSRVRDLRLYGDAPQPSDVAAVLRAAPELRRFHAGRVHRRLEWRSDSAFAGLIHRKVRLLHFNPHPEHLTEEELQLPAEYVRLQTHHFPRLRAVELVRTL